MIMTLALKYFILKALMMVNYSEPITEAFLKL
jgi:hypothetical protein